MSSIFLLIGMWVASAIAVARATFRRLLRGPTVPTWKWRTEWFVAIARATIETAARKRDNRVVNMFGRLVRTPVPASLRDKVVVRRTKLAGVPTDRFVRISGAPDVATILYFHGGGYIFGNPGTHRRFVARLVDATQTSAFAPKYRLAPRDPYPAAVDDAIQAYNGLLDSDIDPRSIVLAGDSAGGGLALAVALRARSEGMPLPGGIMVFSPYADLTHSAYTIPLNVETDHLPIEELSKPNDFYAPGHDLHDPEISPVFAELDGFPPMLIFAGGREMILEDALRIHSHAIEAGADATLVVEEDMMHVWPVALTWEPATDRTLATAAEWVRSKIARDTD